MNGKPLGSERYYQKPTTPLQKRVENGYGNESLEQPSPLRQVESFTTDGTEPCPEPGATDSTPLQERLGKIAVPYGLDIKAGPDKDGGAEEMVSIPADLMRLILNHLAEDARRMAGILHKELNLPEEAGSICGRCCVKTESDKAIICPQCEERATL